MPSVTRTINPLHFEDLEPHRFEDLVRQLAYDFRLWKSIEATGRLGGDDGIDIRATETFSKSLGEPVEEEEDETEPARERLWVIQCKREKRLGPTDLKRIVQEAVRSLEDDGYGLIISAACDFSKKSRDAALAAARPVGLQELFLWGKAELEDMLFQPKNDHLLFAYFGISLQVRRRSMKSSLRTRLATKRQAMNKLGGPHTSVLIRDAGNNEYPQIKDPQVFRKRPDWKYFEFAGHEYPDHLVFIVNKHYALGDLQTRIWDVYEGYDSARPLEKVHGLPDEVNQSSSFSKVNAYWSTKPDKEKGWYIHYGLIHYDQILAIDEHGDVCHKGPHLFVDFKGETGPFDWFSVRLEIGSYTNPDIWTPDPIKRQKLFPSELPEPSPLPPAA